MPNINGKIDPAHIDGPGAAAGHVMTWDGGKSVWSPPAGGGGVMGTATIRCTFPTLTSNVTSTAATGSSLLTSSGTHGTAQSSGDVTYCTDNVNSLYIVSGQLSLGSVSAFTASHIHSTYISEWVLEGGLLTLMFNGSGGQHTPVLTRAPFTLNSSGGMPPELEVGSSGGTGLTFTGATLTLLITRLAA